MRRFLYWGLAISSLAGSVKAQEASIMAQAPIVAAMAPTSPGSTITIPRDTPVELMAFSEVSTASAKPGQRFKLLVNRAISISGRQVIPLGTPAYGEVISAVDSGGLGKTGKMSARLLHIDLSGVEIPLDGETSAKGTGAGSAGVAVLFAGLAGLFHRGNNAKIKAGEIIAGFVAEDVTLAVSTTTVR
jgi:hypothetical protein